MSLNHVILTLLTVILISFGQVLFKLTAMDIKNINFVSIFQPKLILALCIYAIATGLWIAVLRHTPLKFAYPFFGLVFLFVPILSWFFLDEQISINTIVGGLAIIIGIWVAVS